MKQPTYTENEVEEMCKKAHESGQVMGKLSTRNIIFSSQKQFDPHRFNTWWTTHKKK